MHNCKAHSPNETAAFATLSLPRWQSVCFVKQVFRKKLPQLISKRATKKRPQTGAFVLIGSAAFAENSNEAVSASLFVPFGYICRITYAIWTRTMSLTTYSLYLAAVAVLVLSPGPTMLMCMTTALNDGKSSALAAAAGSISAVLGVMTLSALGLGALLAASELAFTIVKVIGAIYLIWLGIKTFCGNAGAIDIKRSATDSKRRLRSPYVRGLLVGSSNPKAILFFTAFFPQFLNPIEPFAPQYGILALTFITFEFSVLAACASGVSAIAPVLRSSWHMRWINKVTGGLFATMGGLLLLSRRHA
jgi:threonine/homoserine/homoserine lactone efflux protein